ncbi:membrane protein [Gaetbulibacter aestuarii]
MFSTGISAQNLHLKIEGESERDTTVLEVLNYRNIFEDVSGIYREVDSVQNIIYKMGYIESQHSALTKENDSTYFVSFKLGKKFETIKIRYDNKEWLTSALLSLISSQVTDNYFEIPFSSLESALHFLSSKISEQGIPFSKIQLKNLEIEGDDLTADLTLIPDEQIRHIDAIEIKGYEKFPKSFLRYFLNIKKGQLFNLSEIKEKTGQLRNLNFASQLKSPEVLFTKDSTTLYLYLEKRKSNTFDGFLGFGTNETTNKIQFNGYLNLNLVNTLNYGESFRIFYKSDETDQQQFEVNIDMPYLFNSPLGAELALRLFRRDSSFTTVDQSFKTNYQMSSKHRIALGITSRTSNNLLNNATTSNLANYATRFFSGSYHFRNPQFSNLLFPFKSSFYFEGNLGSRKSDGMTTKQSFLIVDAMHIFNLNIKNSIYFRGHVESLVSDTLFENELLRFGGINSIRGFQENSLLANSYGILNTEYRLSLSNNLYVHSITDLGYFENKISNMKKKLFSYGIGLGIITKAGLFKLNYAAAKIENEPFKVSNSKVHVSLTTNF